MSFSNESHNFNQQQTSKISFSESKNKDQLDVFKSYEITPNTNTNYQNFEHLNTNINKDQYFNFNLKTLPTDSIEDITVKNRSNTKPNNNINNLKYSDDNVYKITSSDLLEVGENRNHHSSPNEIFISQNYISTKSVEELDAPQIRLDNPNVNSSIFNNNINDKYNNTDIMKTTLNKLKYINIVNL